MKDFNLTFSRFYYYYFPGVVVLTQFLVFCNLNCEKQKLVITTYLMSNNN